MNEAEWILILHHQATPDYQRLCYTSGFWSWEVAHSLSFINIKTDNDKKKSMEIAFCLELENIFVNILTTATGDI